MVSYIDFNIIETCCEERIALMNENFEIALKFPM
jgi:hypothetical protein